VAVVVVITAVPFQIIVAEAVALVAVLPTKTLLVLQD